MTRKLNREELFYSLKDLLDQIDETFIENNLPSIKEYDESIDLVQDEDISYLLNFLSESSSIVEKNI